MMINSIDDTRRLLKNWGRWSRERLGTEFYAIHPMWRDAVEHKSQSYEGLFNDEIALAIDSAVAQLQHFDDLGYELVVGYYRNGDSLRALSVRYQRSVAVLRQVLRGAEGYLSGIMLNASSEPLAA